MLLKKKLISYGSVLLGGIVKVKRGVRANALKENKYLYKTFAFKPGMIKGTLAEGRKKK